MPTDELQERDFSTQERKDAADSGAAMKDGSYPIKTEQDLKNLFNHIHGSSTAGYIHKTDERLARIAKESRKNRPVYLRSVK